MKVLPYTTQLQLSNTAIAVGKFDGIHLGHQSVLQELLKQRSVGLQSVVVTFDRSPRTITQQETESSLLTEQERYLVYEQMGIDAVVVLPVQQSLLQMPAEEFLEQVLCRQLGMKYIVAGSDFCFGQNRTGNTAFLKQMAEKFGYRVAVLEKLQKNARDISSTYIKQLLKLGKMKEIAQLLGHPYTIVGKVVYGNQLGRTVGMPTINLLPEPVKLLPPNGVYAARVHLQDRVYSGITNIGYKPTVARKQIMGVEMHIFDYSGNAYGEIVSMELLQFVRPERKFPNLEAVKKQVDQDISIIKNTVAGYKQ